MGPWESPDGRLVKAMGHPLRLRILDLVATRGESSPTELARELEQPLATVSHHVRLLRDLAFVELTRTAPRRGAVEHFYRIARLPFLTDADWQRLPPVLRRGLAAQTFRRIFAVAAEAGAAGAFDRPGAHLDRVSLSLDEEGWRELSALLVDALYTAQDIQRASDDRRARRPKRHEHRSELVILHFAGGGSSGPPDGRMPSAEPALPSRG